MKWKTTFGNKTQVYCDIEEVAIYYKRIYFNAIDTITACIQDRFNQLGFRTCESINQLLLNAVNDKNYEEQLKTVLAVCGDNLYIITLATQLESLKVSFSSDKYSIKDIIETLKNFSVNSENLFLK